jgi:predicted metal-binding protein/predicted O-methyltransferase YrrM
MQEFLMDESKTPISALDPQADGTQYLEDLATAYWFSETLFTAVELDVFSLLELEGGTAEQTARALGFDPQSTERFLQALCSLGLLTHFGGRFYNSKVASRHLVKGKELYQGNSILWRRRLRTPWEGLKGAIKAGTRACGSDSDDPEALKERIRRYIDAMDDIARMKTREILRFFDYFSGSILDVGAGSGTVSVGFLERFPDSKAILIDLPPVVEYASELLSRVDPGGMITFRPGNVLEQWPVEKGAFDLVILSNVLHAYAEAEAAHLLDQAVQRLSAGGLLLIHDFFLEHRAEKAALFDLNMLINTYNGKVFSAKWTCDRLEERGLHPTGLIPLESDTGVIFAGKDTEAISRLLIDSVTRLSARLKALGFRNVRPIAVDAVHVPEWPSNRCRFGCDEYGKPQCPPNSPSPAETRETLKGYSRALLLEGEPPTRDFQLNVLEAEKEAFTAGFYKAFAYWAGPCSLCKSVCAPDGACVNTRMARPSMEAAGIDVFDTARCAGLSLRPLKDRDEYVKYFALLLLE